MHSSRQLEDNVPIHCRVGPGWVLVAANKTVSLASAIYTPCGSKMSASFWNEH